MNHENLTLAPVGNRSCRLISAVGFATLLAAPLVLLSPWLARGAIPQFMDVVMYFYPLRVHAAGLTRAGAMPWWNDSILCGMPLFANPQAALAYPLNWPMLLAPGGVAFTAPTIFQIGLASAMTFALVRRIGSPDEADRAGLGMAGAETAGTAGFWGGLWSGGAVLAGSYLWSRLQYGNYLNVVPWWPLWLLAAHAYAETGRPKWIVAGAAATALAILGGAHQLAAYGFAALGVYGLVMALFVAAFGSGGSGRAGRWISFMLATAICGVLLGAPGWLPQLMFLGETTRAAGTETAGILAGTYGSLGEIVRILAMPIGTGPLGAGPADAEASAAIGVVTLALAGLVPIRRRRLGPRFGPWLAPWSAAWCAALATMIFAWRPVMEAALELVPALSAFHGPRRILGVTQWFLILAAGLGLAARLDTSQDPESLSSTTTDGEGSGGGGFDWIIRLASSIPAVAIAIIGARVFGMDIFQSPALIASAIVVVLMIATSVASSATTNGKSIAVAAWIGLIPLAVVTWRTTDFSSIPAEALTTGVQNEKGRTLAEEGRMFAVDWKPDTSYDFRRIDGGETELPNLSTVMGLRSVDGYEPARSARFERWWNQSIQWPASLQPWRRHFTLFYPPYPADEDAAETIAPLDLAGGTIPRWGFPVYLHERDGRWAGPSPAWPAGVELRIVIRAAEASEAGKPGRAGESTRRHMRVFYDDRTLMETRLDFGPEAQSPVLVKRLDRKPIASSDPESKPEPPDATSLEAMIAQFRVYEIETWTPGRDGTKRLAGVELTMAEGDALVGAFLWDETLAETYKSEAAIAGAMTRRVRYTGPGTRARLIASERDSRTERESGAKFTGEIERITDRTSPNQMQIHVEWNGREPARLRVHEVWWPGWRALVNGTRVEVGPAVEPSPPSRDARFPGLPQTPESAQLAESPELPWIELEIPPGASDIELSYFPPGLMMSGLMALAGIALLAGYTAASRRPDNG